MLREARALSELPADVWQMVVTYLPGPVGYRLRREFWARRLKHLGIGTTIEVGAYFRGAEHISIGANCWIDRNVVILAGPPGGNRATYVLENPQCPVEVGEVLIGDNVRVAENCVLSGMGGLYLGKNAGIAAHSRVFSFSHHYRDLGSPEDRWQYSFSSQARDDQEAMVLGPVYIGDYCGIGLGCTVLPGASLGRGSWVGCNLVVTGAYPEQTLLKPASKPSVATLTNLTIRE